MRDREQRLRWIEGLIGGGQDDIERSSALVIPTPGGDVAIAFTSIDEVVPVSDVRPFAFTPPEFCGVLHRGAALVPVVDAGGEDTAEHVAIVRGRGCLLGLKFHGAPSVVDLNKVDHAYVDLRMGQQFDGKALPVLDADTAIDALLALD